MSRFKTAYATLTWHLSGRWWPVDGVLKNVLRAAGFYRLVGSE
ncbi:MAG: hypothetical protein NTX09_06990 [Verrucomicrobia bacterium]|nr:hypothetical protein [Verrucomicrobiota bacterium]